MTDSTILFDKDQRNQIVSSLDETLFVEAGAGSGKTHSLVERIISLVSSPSNIPLRNIAAITFTEKAAAELKHRIRIQLEKLRSNADDENFELFENALNDLDGAAISTVHGFARRILAEFPIEANLPPRFETVDEINSQVAFQYRIEGLLDDLFADEDWAETLLFADAIEFKPVQHLTDIAKALDSNWDLLTPFCCPDLPADDFSDLITRGHALINQIDGCFGDTSKDSMVKLLTKVSQVVYSLENAFDVISQLEILHQAVSGTPLLSKNANTKGAKKNWHDIYSVRSEYAEFRILLKQRHQQFVDAILNRFLSHLIDFTLRSAIDRRTNGCLEFHDLLVLARNTLRDPLHGSAVRSVLHSKYQRLLLDEFQDTDPIQIELAVLIASSPSSDSSRSWQSLSVEPGRLFFVGDPKQSIYRFRRADIGLFLEARNKFTTEVTELSTNFRSVTPIIEWINAVFNNLIEYETGSQPEYKSLVPLRDPAPYGPGIGLIGQSAHVRKDRIDTIRAAEASDISATILAAKQERWSVQRNNEWAPANFNDMAVLVPRRSSLPSLEKAFTKYGIPYQLESANLVWRSREIRDLIMCLRAINDPTDFLATISALRSPIYGCGDDDLYQYRVNGHGSWNFAELPETQTDDASNIALKGLRHLASLYSLRTLLSPSELIEKLIGDQQLYEQSVISQRPRDSLRRLRYVVDQARAWSDTTGGTLHRFLRWASSQADKNSRAVESVLPESDNDSVRIMTIHAAKGLEFPITIVAGLAGESNKSRGLQVGFTPEASVPMIRCKAGVESSGFSNWLEEKKSLEQAERIRLLYVACTRASDHLIVSVHRSERGDTKILRSEMNAAELIYDGCVDHTEIAFTVPSLPSQPVIKQDEDIQTNRPSRKEWEARRTIALSRPNQLRSISPTGITRLSRKNAVTQNQNEEGLNKHGQDLSETPWRKGRYGSALGRAVHGVLQTIDLSKGTNIAALSASQAAAESISHQSQLVQAFVTSALETEVIKSAAMQRHWRELYVAAPINGLVLEGYIDLMYEEHDNNDLILIDYKTDQITDLTVEDKVLQYRLQGAAYAFAVEATTGQHVKEMKLVFLSSDGGPARVERLDDLHLAIADVQLLTKRVEGH